MTVLVDGAHWSWRGQRWAHLASDHSAEELHRFAAPLGLRRLVFQGDHYDVPAPLRLEALERGAVAVGSRELLHRLRVAGLRHRPPRRPGPWERVLDVAPGSVRDLASLDQRFAGADGLPDHLAQVVRATPFVAELPFERISVTAYRRPGEVLVAIAVPVDAGGPELLRRPYAVTAGRGVGVHVTGGDGRRLVELILEGSSTPTAGRC